MSEKVAQQMSQDHQSNFALPSACPVLVAGQRIENCKAKGTEAHARLPIASELPRPANGR
eukprot:3287157-Heterocapsa_arctica.AAC.1